MGTPPLAAGVERGKKSVQRCVSRHPPKKADAEFENRTQGEGRLLFSCRSRGPHASHNFVGQRASMRERRDSADAPMRDGSALSTHRAVWKKTKCMHASVARMSIREKRRIFALLRNPGVTQDMLLVEYGITMGDFCCMHVLGG